MAIEYYQKRIKTVPPTVTDCSNNGYEVGCDWIDATTGIEYVLVDSTPGAAVWRERTNSETVLLSEKGVANGVATLDGSAKIPDTQIPDSIARDSELHSHTNKAQLDLVTDGDHDVRTDNPHVVTAAQVGNTTAQWNANKIQGKTVDDAAIGNNKVLMYNLSGDKIVYSSSLPVAPGQHRLVVDTTTTSQTYVNLMTVNRVTGANRVKVTVAVACSQTSDRKPVFYRFTLDGVSKGGMTVSTANKEWSECGYFLFLTDPLTAASHEFKVEWRVDSNEGQIRPVARPDTEFFVMMLEEVAS